MNRGEEYLRNISIDNGDFERLKHQLASILTGDDKIHILYGSGNNGKTSFIKILEKYLGDNVTYLSHLYGLNSVDDKDYIVVHDDINNINPTMLRQLVLGDEKKLIICANYYPNICNHNNFMNDAELLATINLIPFNKYIEVDIDLNIVDEFINNPDGLINYIISNEESTDMSSEEGIDMEELLNICI